MHARTLHLNNFYHTIHLKWSSWRWLARQFKSFPANDTHDQTNTLNPKKTSQLLLTPNHLLASTLYTYSIYTTLSHNPMSHCWQLKPFKRPKINMPTQGEMCTKSNIRVKSALLCIVALLLCNVSTCTCMVLCISLHCICITPHCI